jgi:MFS transporter, putative metabolite:H+ symporter
MNKAKENPSASVFTGPTGISNDKLNKVKGNFPVFLLVVTSLGYFVDAFDLVVFSVVRKASIIDLGIATTDAQIKAVGLSLENWQALGLLVGGIIWGVFGDKIGRMKVLFGSIAVYSIANLLNGFLKQGGDVQLHYSILRFFSGLGLAGELGAAVTLVSEAMSPSKRGLGTMIIAAFGLLGCALAAWLGAFSGIGWQTLFIVGGIAGILLLFLRIGVYESSMFLKQEKSIVQKGAFFSLFTNWSRFKRFLQCIVVGLPVYFVVGLPIKFASNFGTAFKITGVSVPIAIMMSYIFLSIGDVVCNYTSQLLKSRKKLFLAFNVLNLMAVLLFTYYPPQNAWQYHYIYCPLLGFSVGYWALIVTNAAEQFGTNLRATVATTVPNFIRSSFIPIALCFTFIEKSLGTIHSAGVIGITCSILALIATFTMKETFGTDLNYEEK